MAPQAQTAKNDNAPTDFRMKDVITMTARLGQVLAEEVDYLNAMQVPKIESLQQEKLFLTGALEAKRKQIAKYPHLMDTIPSQDKEDLEEVVEIFNSILAENHKKLMQAKAVNHKIIQAITHVVRQNTKSRTYNGKGHTGAAPYETLSVTLNKTI